MNRKDRRGNKTTYLSGNTGIRLICEAVAVELLFYAMLAIFRSAFGWQLPIRALVTGSSRSSARLLRVREVVLLAVKYSLTLL